MHESICKRPITDQRFQLTHLQLEPQKNNNENTLPDPFPDLHILQYYSVHQSITEMCVLVYVCMSV